MNDDLLHGVVAMPMGDERLDERTVVLPVDSYHARRTIQSLTHAMPLLDSGEAHYIEINGASVIVRVGSPIDRGERYLDGTLNMTGIVALI